MNQRVLTGLFLLHLIALHYSIAAMEILSWSVFLGMVAHFLRTKTKPELPLLWPLLGLTATVVISLVSNPPIKPFLIQFGFMRWIVLFWTFFAFFQTYWSREFEERVIKVWGYALLSLALFATLQFFTGIDLRHGHILEHEGHLYRATGFFSNSLTFCYVLGTSLFAIALPFLDRLPVKWKLALPVVGALGVVASMSRGALLAAVVTVALYLVAMQRRLVPYFAAAVVGVVLFLSQVWGKLGALMHFRLDSSSNERVNLWRSYTQMWMDHPFSGVGIFQGDKLLPEYYEKLGIVHTFYSHAHNVPLQWAAGAGTFAFVLYIFISVTFLRWAWGLRKSSPWGWSLLLSQIYFHFGSLTEANFFDGEVNHVLIVVWALIAFLHFQSKSVIASH